MDPEKETQVLEPELDEQDQETQESRKQASANDGDKTQTLLYRLWLKSQQKRKPKPGRDGAEKSGEDEPDEEDACETNCMAGGQDRGWHSGPLAAVGADL